MTTDGEAKTKFADLKFEIPDRNGELTKTNFYKHWLQDETKRKYKMKLCRPYGVTDDDPVKEENYNEFRGFAGNLHGR